MQVIVRVRVVTKLLLVWFQIWLLIRFFVLILILGSGNGVLLGRQRFIFEISWDKEYTHNIDGVNIMHKIKTHVSIMQ